MTKNEMINILHATVKAHEPLTPEARLLATRMIKSLYHGAPYTREHVESERARFAACNDCERGIMHEHASGVAQEFSALRK